MSRPPADPPPTPPRTDPPPDNRPPTKPPRKADAEIFAQADRIRADFPLPLRKAFPTFESGEHRPYGRISRP